MYNIYSTAKKKAYFFVSCFESAFLMLCDCKSSVVILGGAMGLSVVCDCGISWSYSLAVLY